MRGVKRPAFAAGDQGVPSGCTMRVDVPRCSCVFVLTKLDWCSMTVTACPPDLIGPNTSQRNEGRSSASKPRRSSSKMSGTFRPCQNRTVVSLIHQGNRCLPCSHEACQELSPQIVCQTHKAVLRPAERACSPHTPEMTCSHSEGCRIRYQFESEYHHTALTPKWTL